MDMEWPVLIIEKEPKMDFCTKNECRMDGRCFRNGADIVARGRLLDCVNGKWEEVVLVSGI